MTRYFLYFSIFFFLLTGCHKDYESGEEITKSQFLPEIKSQVLGSVLGYVYDENNLPVEGALVEIYGAVTRTDKFGVFQFENKALDQSGTYIRISKAGYMTGSDKVFPAGGLAYSRTRLFALHKNDKLSTATGGEVTMKNGGKLVFPPDVVMKENGAAYEGNFYVTSVFLSPANPSLADEMPGELLGGNLSGITSVLGTAGMFGVVMTGENGEKLQVKSEGKVKFFIPALSKNKPAEVPLWHFDENRGYWIEEGVARMVDGYYVGDVSHFSFWNVDVPYPLVELCGNVVSNNGKPIPWIQIQIEVEGLGTRHGYIDSYGNFCGLVPKDKPLTIIIKRYGCDEILKTIQVGPFSGKTTLDPIILSDPTVSIEGKVTCENVPVKDGIVVIQYGGQNYPVTTDENGYYFYQLFKCNNNDQVSIFAYDKLTFKASTPETILISGSTIKNISVCTVGCTIDGSIADKCDYLEMVISQGSGSVYEFNWSTGDSLARTIKPLPVGAITICVTVTDPGVSNCQQVFCFNYGGKLSIFVETECNNPMEVFPAGGVPPYKFKWHNGQTTNSVILAQGESYCVTVTDQANCEAVRCGTFEEVWLDVNISDCHKSTFNIASSIFDRASIQANNNTIQVTTLQNLSVFVTGFNFAVIIEKGQCREYRQYRLPQFKGLTIKNIIHSSCQGCTDGYIDVGFDVTAGCENCTAGGVRIFDINNLNVDLSNINTLKLMPKGEYYVVTEDANTGCYVAIQKVKIN